MIGVPRQSPALDRIRSAAESDRLVLDAFIEDDIAEMPYSAIPAYFLHLALDGAGNESQALVAESGGEPVGFALFGEVAGTRGAARVHFVAVSAAHRLRGIGKRLCGAVVDHFAAHGGRLVVAEVPAHPAFSSGLALLARMGFEEVARVNDYYSDGIDLLLLERRINVS